MHVLRSEVCISVDLYDYFILRIRVEHVSSMVKPEKPGNGKKFNAVYLKECYSVYVFVCASTCASGAKYSLLAYTTLCLPEAEGSFQSHSLIVLQDGKR